MIFFLALFLERVFPESFFLERRELMCEESLSSSQPPRSLRERELP